MPFEYVCRHPSCLTHNQWLSCFHCCKEFHDTHTHSLTSIKQILTQLEAAQEQTESKMLSVLLRGMQTCHSPEDIKTNLA